MEYRNVELFLETLFDFEAAGSRDIFEVDPAEGRCDALDRFDDFVGVLRVQADRECVDSCEFVEQDRLAFHNRQRCFRTDIAESEDSRSVRYDCNQIAFVRIAVDFRFVVADASAGFRYARCVGCAKIVPCLHIYFRYDRNLAFVVFVHFQCCLIVVHVRSPFFFVQ